MLYSRFLKFRNRYAKPPRPLLSPNEGYSCRKAQNIFKAESRKGVTSQVGELEWEEGPSSPHRNLQAPGTQNMNVWSVRKVEVSLGWQQGDPPFSIRIITVRTRDSDTDPPLPVTSAVIQLLSPSNKNVPRDKYKPKLPRDFFLPFPQHQRPRETGQYLITDCCSLEKTCWKSLKGVFMC